MRHIDKIYIDGAFVNPHGTEVFDLFNPTTGQSTGTVKLGDEEDARLAIAAAKRAFPAFSITSKAERIEMLQALRNAVAADANLLMDLIVEEYGAPIARSTWMATGAADAFLSAAATLKDFPLTRQIGTAEVVMEPVGVVGLITPWNSNCGFICSKLSMAIAAGCTAVIKPSEMSARQTQALTEALHRAGLPAGVFNIVNGRGDVVGAKLTTHPDVSKISFTGSTAVGKSIVRAGADTMKRVTLELGGKSPTVVLDDADLQEAIPHILAAGFGNNGQACINGTRVLLPKSRLAEFSAAITEAVAKMQVGDPRDPKTALGPLVSRRQFERVEHYIKLGIEEGAEVLLGGEGSPEGLEDGFFVKPTVFGGVTNDMTIAREEIFGPVIALLTYDTEEDAIRIANDTTYGLHAYVLSANFKRARAVAARLQAGRVSINGGQHEPLAPFGGFKQSGIGREYGVYGLDAYLEPKAVLGSFTE